ncbi:MAG: hypothetical protein ACOC44_16310 [Promethearchaeia archaeon]
MGLFSRTKSNDTEKCNICGSEMDSKYLYTCPNCGNTEGTEKCTVCDSEMNKYRLYTCQNCGNTIDEHTLEKKRRIKEKFKNIT